MDEIGVVKKVEDLYAIVVVEKKSACDQCRMGCKMTEEGTEIEALNLARAKVGQKVKIQMKPFTYLKGSLLVFGFPALALIVGAVIGREWLSVLFPSFDKELLSAITGFTACLLAFVIAKLISAGAGENPELKPVVEEILGE